MRRHQRHGLVAVNDSLRCVQPVVSADCYAEEGKRCACADTSHDSERLPVTKAAHRQFL